MVHRTQAVRANIDVLIREGVKLAKSRTDHTTQEQDRYTGKSLSHSLVMDLPDHIHHGLSTSFANIVIDSTSSQTKDVETAKTKHAHTQQFVRAGDLVDAPDTLAIAQPAPSASVTEDEATNKWGQALKRERCQTTMIMKEGQIIGESAKPLDKETKAMRMMRAMGYQEGKGLGKYHQGKTDAIATKIKLSNAGLGAPIVPKTKEPKPLPEFDPGWECTGWDNSLTEASANNEPIDREWSSFTPLMRNTYTNRREHRYPGIVVRFKHEGKSGDIGDIKLLSKYPQGQRTVTHRTRHFSEVMVEVVSGKPKPEQPHRIAPLPVAKSDVLMLECQKGKVIVAKNLNTMMIGEVEIAHCLVDEDVGLKNECVEPWDSPKGLERHAHTITSAAQQYGQPQRSTFPHEAKPKEEEPGLTWDKWELMTRAYIQEKTAVTHLLPDETSTEEPWANC